MRSPDQRPDSGYSEELSNPYPNVIPQARNSDEARAILEGNAMLSGVDLETAERWTLAEELRRSGEPTRQERIERLDPVARDILRDLDLL